MVWRMQFFLGAKIHIRLARLKEVRRILLPSGCPISAAGY
jgi:hypothetical protein